MDRAISRELIHCRLIDRLLPRVQAVDVWDGPGDGRPCDGCALPVTTLQRAIEAVASRWLSMYCHDQCFDVWESERVVLTGATPRPSHGRRDAPDQVAENDRERALLVKGGILGRRSLELTDRSRTVIARSARLMAESDRRNTH